MRVSKTLCDRCGKECEDVQQVIHRDPRKYAPYGGSSDVRVWDLCDACFLAFLSFLQHLG